MKGTSDPKAWVINPPEFTKLLEKYGGAIREAERAAGLYVGALSKFRTGAEKYGDNHKAKIMAAIEGKPLPRILAKGFVPPDTCPPLMKNLLNHLGSKSAVAKALGSSEANVYAVINGKREMLPAWKTRAKAAMGLSAIYSQGDEEEMSSEKPPVASAIPEFVMWDRKSFGEIQVKMKGGSKKKGRTIKKVPQPIVDLFTKYGTLADASRAMGFGPGTLGNWLDTEADFNLKRQQLVYGAMHGAPGKGIIEMGEDFDKYLLGIAICLLKGTTYDRIAEVADILNGKMVFRKNTSGGWIVIYRMKIEDLPRFKKLAIRDASEIVCP